MVGAKCLVGGFNNTLISYNKLPVGLSTYLVLLWTRKYAGKTLFSPLNNRVNKRGVLQ